MTEFLNNFDKNLLELSVNKEDLVEAKKEWHIFREEKCSEKKTCICKHKINNVRYYLNIYNGNIICCGTVCCNKFNLDKIEVHNKTLGEILKLKNEYHQFSTIQEYLDYVKDELRAFMVKEIESADFNKLIFLLNDIDNINKSYGLDIFNIHIENIKGRITELIPSYIESEITKDPCSIFELMQKITKLSRDYQIEKPDISVFKNSIQKVVEHNITHYSGHITPKFQEKVDIVIQKINRIKEETGKSLILKDFFIEMNEKLKNKIQSIRDANAALDKAKWEAQKKYRERRAEKNYF